ncbi:MULTISPECIES: cysteine hydrolase family protein [Carboxydothermus]|uniref:Isochorismatase family protein n=2 Tax=Carboxydothermus TaxID=129957 RepID=Q3AEA0_CARHZ|nr:MULTISPECIES: cysteine hydrolase [Carboxydothermus]ABB16042.1 isochorismatase family protein [Carboxydothermus hydrogenoformans Z-2901]NYE56546.1 nicotinamidase-related amidase [Carboxydothermus ferrireducens DSM 11255]
MKGDRHCIVIIDMLNDFIGPNAPLRCPDGEKIVPNLQKLVEFAHENGINVVFVQEAHRKNDADFRVRPVHAVKGTWGSDFIPELRPDEEKGDYIVQKRRHSAFAYTDLDLYLREEKIDTVVVTGVWTNVCVRSTASDALYHAYNVIAISDCCASANEEMHQAGLRDMALFAEVMTLEEYMKEWPNREGAKK